jgi:hypothetical protein
MLFPHAHQCPPASIAHNGKVESPAAYPHSWSAGDPPPHISCPNTAANATMVQSFLLDVDSVECRNECHRCQEQGADLPTASMISTNAGLTQLHEVCVGGVPGAGASPPRTFSMHPLCIPGRNGIHNPTQWSCAINNVALDSASHREWMISRCTAISVAPLPPDLPGRRIT